MYIKNGFYIKTHKNRGGAGAWVINIKGIQYIKNGSYIKADKHRVHGENEGIVYKKWVLYKNDPGANPKQLLSLRLPPASYNHIMVDTLGLIPLV